MRGLVAGASFAQATTALMGPSACSPHRSAEASAPQTAQSGDVHHGELGVTWTGKIVDRPPYVPDNRQPNPLEINLGSNAQELRTTTDNPNRIRQAFIGRLPVAVISPDIRAAQNSQLFTPITPLQGLVNRSMHVNFTAEVGDAQLYVDEYNLGGTWQTGRNIWGYDGNPAASAGRCEQVDLTAPIELIGAATASVRLQFVAHPIFAATVRISELT